jgi:hypothetical protein
LETQRDVRLVLVGERLSRLILETIAEAGRFDEKPDSGIALRLDVEDAVGIGHQVRKLSDVVNEET